ncbi:MAG: HPr-rel-A system PqqD family peptide chaperone [Sedimenticola sp.]
MIVDGPEKRWQLSSYTRLEFSRYDDEVVVFDTGSGNTHVVDPVAADLLLTLSDKPHTKKELSNQIVTSFEFEQDSSIEKYVDSLLHSLAKQNIIQPYTE